jgi:hypothetical protein
MRPVPIAGFPNIKSWVGSISRADRRISEHQELGRQHLLADLRRSRGVVDACEDRQAFVPHQVLQTVHCRLDTVGAQFLDEPVGRLSDGCGGYG